MFKVNNKDTRTRPYMAPPEINKRWSQDSL